MERDRERELVYLGSFLPPLAVPGHCLESSFPALCPPLTGACSLGRDISASHIMHPLLCKENFVPEIWNLFLFSNYEVIDREKEEKYIIKK